MQEVIIKNVPTEFIEKYGTKINYSEFYFTITEKKNKIDYWDDEEIKNMGKISSFTSNSF